jgi:flagellar capping protein FliD
MGEISFKGLVTDRDKSLGGFISGLDWPAIVENTFEAQTLGVFGKEAEIDLSNKKIVAYSQLKSLVLNYSNATNDLRNNLSMFRESSNLLQQRTVSLTTNGNDNANSYLSLIPSNTLPSGNYTFSIASVAANEIMQTYSVSALNTQVVGSGLVPNTTLGASDDTCSLSPLTTNTVTLDVGDTLQEVADKINSCGSPVTATIVKPTETTYSLQISSDLTGTANAFTISDPSNIFSPALFEVQAATDAQFTVNSTTITRSSNTITDYIEGLTINLQTPTPVGETIFAQIGYNPEIAQTAIINWVDSYNDLIKFSAAQQAKGLDGKYLDTAILQNDMTMFNILMTVQNETTYSPEGNNIYYNSLDDLGITRVAFTDANPLTGDPAYRNLLQINPNLLSYALKENIEGVQQWFQFTFQSTSNDLVVMRKPETLNPDVYNFTIEVDVNNPSGTIVQFVLQSNTLYGTFVPYNSDDYTQGGTIYGQPNSDLAGIQIAYSGAGVTTATINMSYGVAEQINDEIKGFFAKNYPDPNSTSTQPVMDIFSSEIASENTIQHSLREDIDDIYNRAEKYKEAMIGKIYSSRRSCI